MRRALPTIVILAVSAGLWYGATSSVARSWWSDLTRPKLPAAENAAQAIAETLTANLNLNTNTTRNTNTAVTNTAPVNVNRAAATIPAEKNLAVPFTSQAPAAKWDDDHQEFCEEASILMVGRYYQQRDIADAADAEQGLQALKRWQLEHFGYYYDTTAAENAEILAGVYGLKTELLVDPTIAQIKAAIAAGHPVIVPAAGRELGNPNFTAPGPIYHNLVIRGYTKDGKFITNDPGTRKGKQYVYAQSVVMAAIHDWVPKEPRTTARNGDVAKGRRVVLIVTKGE